MYNPTVSIVIPAYNAANYLAEAIDSALAQTYPHIEIIVVNDGSRDEGATAAVAARYGDRIRYVEKENGGSSSALNTGIAHMTGEWFSWLSHDDLYTPEKVAAQVAYMNSLGLPEEELRRCVFFSASDLIDGQGKTIRAIPAKDRQARADRVNAVPGNEYLIAEPTENNFHGCSCLIHKNVFSSVGGFDEKLRLLNDIDLWFRIYAAGYRVQVLPEALVKGRVHERQISKSIGYSYHNPEQDLFWGRSLDWLLENAPDNLSLFMRYGRNAYLKTRYADGKRAYAYVASKAPAKGFKIFFLKLIYGCRAAARSAAKKIYLKLKT